MAMRFFYIGDLVQLAGSREAGVGLIIKMEVIMGMEVAHILWEDGAILPCSASALTKLSS